MSKNYYKTAEGLIFIIYNTSSEDKIISEFKDVELEELNRKNENKKSVGIVAIEQGKNKVFKYLVDQGIDLTIKNGAGYDLLFISTMMGNYECAKLLLDKGDFKDSLSATLDYGVLAISSQDIEIIKLLIEKGGKLSEYYHNYLFNIENDHEFKYDREDLRSFYQKNICCEKEQICIKNYVDSNIYFLNNTNESQQKDLGGELNLLNLDD